MLLRDILAHNARAHPGRVALSSGEADINHAQLLDRVCRYAHALHAAEVGKGDRVAILSRSNPGYVELLFAVTQIGAVLVPISHLLVGREQQEILRDAEPRLLLVGGEFERVVEEIRPGLPTDTQVFRIGGEPGRYPPLLDAGRGEFALPTDYVAVSDSDIALQIYTSGTSGRPRGAMLSHRNLAAASMSAALELGLSRNDITLSCFPLPYPAGTGRLLRHLTMGGRVVLLEDFDPEETLWTIERRKITHVFFTPTMMAQILDLASAPRFNLATLRKVLYGGSPIPLDLLKRSIRFFGCEMVQSYGQVESSGVLSFLHPEDHSLDESAPYMRKLASVGKEAIGVEVRVVNEEGNAVSHVQAGEVIARGANIFEGYFRDPGGTKEVLRNGWLYTGDVASVDKEGYIYLLDRKRDTLLVGGIPVSPREIETVIAEHPAVSEAAVIPRPDYVWGEIPLAIVTLKKGEPEDAGWILDHCRRNMAPFKVPGAIDFVSSLPKNSAGKVLKAKLREGMAKGGFTPRTPRP